MSNFQKANIRCFRSLPPLLTLLLLAHLRLNCYYYCYFYYNYYYSYFAHILPAYVDSPHL